MDYGDISLGLIIQVRSQSEWIWATSGSPWVNKTGPRSISRYSKNPFLRECSANTKAQWIYANFIQVQFLLKPKRMMRFLYQTINIGTNWAALNLKCSCIFPASLPSIFLLWWKYVHRLNCLECPHLSFKTDQGVKIALGNLIIWNEINENEK